jgi:outer membrane cobalamin receptor
MQGLAVCLLFALMPMATAQDDMDFASMSLEDLLNVEVTVASKSEETTAQAPSSVTVFTRQEMLNMGIFSVEELLNYVPGFQTARTGENGSQTEALAVRGSRTTPESERVLFLLDGQRLNAPWTGGALQYVNQIPISMLKQVEVIRGPGSALYGSNAFVGVVNLVTNTTESGGQIAYGSFDARSGYATLVKEVGDFKGSLYVRAYDDDGEDYENLHPFFGTEEFGLTDTSDPREFLDLYSTLEYKGFNLRIFHTERGYPDFTQFGEIGNGYNRIDSEATSANLSYQIVENDKWNIRAFAGWFETKYFQKEFVFPAGIPAAFGLFPADSTLPLLGGNVIDTSQEMYTLDVSHQLNEKNSLQFGASFRQATLDEATFNGNFIALNPELGPFSPLEPTANGLPIFPTGYTQADLTTRDILGIYVQDKHKFTDNFIVTGGLRYDDYSDFGDTVNLRGAVIYTADFGSTFKAMYGEAFRAPSFKEQTNEQFSFTGNRDLQPEEIETLELSWGHAFEQGRVSLTYYDSEIADGVVLVTELQPNGFIQASPQNLQSLSLTGLEFEGQFSAGPFLFRAAYTDLQDAQENPQFSETFYSFYVNFSKERFNINLNGFYRDETISRAATEAAPAVVLEDYWKYNATFRYSFAQDYYVEFIGSNIFDEDYRTVDTSARLENGLQARGAQYFASVGFKF